MFLLVPGLAAAQGGPAKVVFLGVEVDDSAGNGDGELEPGETATLRVRLYNDGPGAASGVTGTLTYLGAAAGVTVPVGSAGFADLVAKGAPGLSNAPHFQVHAGGSLPCGAVLPFRLDVTASGGSPSSFDFSFKLGKPVDFDLIQDPPRRFNEQEATFEGAKTGDGAGSSAAVADVNGDGYDDVILGAPQGGSLNDSRPGAGQVYLIYGGPRQWSDVDLASPGAGVVRFWGANAGDGLGSAVAAGDVNGDGYDDLILGAASSDSLGATRVGAGVVYLIYGRASAWTDTDLGSPPAGVVRFWGASELDGLGFAVASGDVDGDGHDDLALGAPEGDSLGGDRAGAGQVYVVYGKADPWIDTDLASPSAGVSRFWGAEAGDRVGSALASGDLDGDGRDELVIGAPAADSTGNSRTSAGEVYVARGQAAQWPDADLLASPTGVSRIFGADDGESAGSSLAAGDVNGDGVADLIVGSPGAASAGYGRPFAGAVDVVYGSNAAPADVDLAQPPAGVIRLWGDDGGDRFGSAVAARDVNGDGYDDLILGSSGSDSAANERAGAGEVTILHGRASALSAWELGGTASGASTIFGADDEDQAGDVLAAGDVDGDGLADLVVAAPSADSHLNQRPSAGEAHLWYGKPTDTYVARATAISFIDAGAGTSLALSCDDCSVALPIGFAFPYYGEEFSTIYVSSNGLLSFAPIQDAASKLPACLPDRAGDNLLVAPLWDDLAPQSGGPGSGVFALVQGSAPNRRLTIEWKDVPHAPGVGAATFEATLFESTGQILFQYQDLIFGSGGFDAGASAVVGFENRVGARGASWSCFTAGNVGSGSGIAFHPSTPILENHVDHGEGLFTATGLWHTALGGCAPPSHSGTSSWYYGAEAICTYDTGAANSGTLSLPSLADLPADAKLSIWYRRAAESSRPGFDVSRAQISTTGTAGPYTDLLDVTDATGSWKYSGPVSLASGAGATADLRFLFDTVDDADNSTLGFMIDDVQIAGCNAVASGPGGEEPWAVGYADPAAVCEGSGTLLDAIGSSCGAGAAEPPSSYQWKESGAVIPGATSATYVVSSGKPAGSYSYTVLVGCPGGSSAESAPVSLNVAAAPSAVGPTLMVDTTGGLTQLHLTWGNVASASDYVVYESPTPNGTFTAVTGTTSSGVTGLTVPVPAGTFKYYLVAGRNAPCGEGPQR